MSTLDDWTNLVCVELGLEPSETNQKTVLNLTRVVAHTVDRPAALLAAIVTEHGVHRAPYAQSLAALV